MRRSATEIFRLVPVIAAFAALASFQARAQDREDRYTGVALSYYFGGAGHGKDTADLSFGAIDHTMDSRQSVSVTQWPLLQVPLVRRTEPVVAPLAAIADAVRWVAGRATALVPAHSCTMNCPKTTLVLPDLAP